MIDLSSIIIDQLNRSEYWTQKTKISEECIQNLICPECGETSAWAYKQRPWSINCNRLNECAARIKTLDLFPDILQLIEKDNPPTKNDPNRPATVYLQSRGLEEALKGLKYEYWNFTREGCGGGVMFLVADNIWNGRIFNPPKGEGKTHNKGSTSGFFWRHPGVEYKPFEETYVTEGIIDALSFIELGKQAIAVLSSGQDPSKIDLSEFKDLVLAFDNDPAGRSALIKWQKVFPQAKTIMPIDGDWNDLLISNSKDKVHEYFKENIQKFEGQATLAIAKNANSYAEIYYNLHEHPPGLFIFDKCYYYSFTKKDDSKKNDPGLTTYRVSNFTLDVDHYQLDTTIQEEPVNKYFIKIKPKKGKSVLCSVSANELSSPNGLTTMFLQRGRVLWEGDRRPSLDLVRRIVESKSPVVRQTKIMGYDSESNCYIFKDFMLNSKGQIITLSTQGFFKLSNFVYIRPAPYPTIKPVKGATPKDIYDLFHGAWPNKSLVGLSWMVAGWFVNQIKNTIGFFPFLSFYGEPGSGKTMCTRRLNACQCLDEEGLPMRKVNTAKGEIRKLAQRSGLVMALLENNKEDSARFDLDTILTLYNSNPLQTRAKKTNDIQTEDLPFLSSLLFVQNIEPFSTKAQKERVISIPFDKEAHTEESTEALNKLTKISVSELAYFFQFVMNHRNKFEDCWLNEFTKAQNDLKNIIQDARLNANHALILAFHRILSDVLKAEYNLQPYIEEIGKRKEAQCLSRDETLADLFFSILFDFDFEMCRNFIGKENESTIAIHLQRALDKIKASNRAFPFNNVTDLQIKLKEHPAFIENNKEYTGFLNSDEKKERRKAWFFDRKKINKD